MPDTYYIRSHGKISGPFDLAALQKLVRRGTVSRMHELSSDRISWTQATDYQELFPARAANVQVEYAAPRNTSAPAATAQHMPGGYFYIQNGTNIGPVPLPVLISLAQSGILQPDDPCWKDGAETTNSAAQLPALAAIFSVRGTPGMIGGSRARTPVDASTAARALESCDLLVRITAIVAGAIMLLFLNLPVWQADGKTLWWWDLLKLPHQETSALLCFFVLFTGIAAVAMGIFAKGAARAWVFVGIASVSFILFLVIGINQRGSDGYVFFELIVFYLTAALIGVSYSRFKAPDAAASKTFQGILGGTLVFAMVIVAVVDLTQNAPARYRHDLFGVNELPGWVVVALTTATIGAVAGLIAGILGLVGLRPQFSGVLNGTTICFAINSISLSVLASMIIVWGVVNLSDFPQKGFLIFLFFRVFAVFCGFLALMAIGLAEVFVESHYGAWRTQRALPTR
jgi:hypothetical protein